MTHRMGEEHPRDYETNPCAHLAFDMATDERAIPDSEFLGRLATAGCTQHENGEWYLAQATPITSSVSSTPIAVSLPNTGAGTAPIYSLMWVFGLVMALLVIAVRERLR